MPSPVYSAGTSGNVFGGVSGIAVANGGTKNVAAFLDLSTVIEGQLTCELTTATAPGSLTTFSAFKAYAAGASAPITLTASAAATTTSLSVSSASGLRVGQMIALVVASTKIGELATISAISGTTLTVGALTYSYSSADLVYLMSQTAVFAIAPTPPSGVLQNNKDYSGTMFLGPSQWIIAALNADTSQPVTVSATVDKITAIQ